MKIMVCTPMYGGQCSGAYTKLAIDLSHSEHEVTFNFVLNESLIQRARNQLAFDFIKSDSDCLLFIDADMSMPTSELIEYIINSGKPIIGAVCPLKHIDWDYIKKVPSQSSVNLKYISTKYNFNTYSNEDTMKLIKENEPFRVANIGTAVLKIDREIIENLYNDSNIMSYNQPGSEGIKDIFPVFVDNNRFISEDYGFCSLCINNGFEVYAHAGVHIQHWGTTPFEGNLHEELTAQN